MNNVLLQNLIELIARHTGLNIRVQDKQALVNKVFARMQALKLNTPEQYYQLLDSNTKHSSTLETQCDRQWKALTILIPFFNHFEKRKISYLLQTLDKIMNLAIALQSLSFNPSFITLRKIDELASFQPTENQAFNPVWQKRVIIPCKQLADAEWLLGEKSGTNVRAD